MASDSARIEKAAEIVVETCLAVRNFEKVLVVTDAKLEGIGQKILEAAEKISAHCFLLKAPVGARSGEEPSQVVAAAMKEADVVICPTAKSLTHTQALRRALLRGARAATMPNVTEEVFCRAIDVDYEELRKNSLELKRLLEKTLRVHVTTSSGTDAFFSVNKKVLPDFGIIGKGEVGNLPAGETFFAPVPKSSSGIVVVDRMPACRPKTRVSFRNGWVQETDDADFSKSLFAIRNGRNIAEFGIGVNPKAILSGSLTEEEKVLGTCHVGFGSNFDFGGRVKADVHWDGVVLKPTVFFDDKKIMDEGELLV